MSVTGDLLEKLRMRVCVRVWVCVCVRVFVFSHNIVILPERFKDMLLFEKIEKKRPRKATSDCNTVSNHWYLKL